MSWNKVSKGMHHWSFTEAKEEKVRKSDGWGYGPSKKIQTGDVSSKKFCKSHVEVLIVNKC